MRQLSIENQTQAFTHKIELKLVKQLTPHPQITIKDSTTVAKYAKEIYPVGIEHREAVIAIYLNRQNETIGHDTISVGGVSSSIADMKMIFQPLFACNASSLILVHNHPSGNLKPSKSDIDLTSKVKEVATLLDAPLLDHVIITENSHFSFSDEGIL